MHTAIGDFPVAAFFRSTLSSTRNSYQSHFRITPARFRILYPIDALMPTRQPKAGNSAGTALMEGPTGERERIFDAFRQWGYLEADLDPLGFLQPVPNPDLQLEGEIADEARSVYCSTIGAEFMYITDLDRRRWIQQRLEGLPPS